VSEANGIDAVIVNGTVIRRGVKDAVSATTSYPAACSGTVGPPEPMRRRKK